jgi:hypothetical protein
MEGFERLSPADDDLVEDLLLSYTLEQLRHHVLAQVLFANPPP